MDLISKGLLFLGGVSSVLGQAGSGSSDLAWVGYLLNGGPFAVVVFLLVTDRLTTPGERDRLRKEVTAAHEREERLNQTIRDDFVPVITRSLEAVALNREVVERASKILERIEPKIDSSPNGG